MKLAASLRSDGAAARREVDASTKRATQAHSQRLPRLDLIASYGYGGTSAASRFLTYGDSTDVRSSSWTLGLSASLFGRNDAASAVDQRAEAALESSRVAAAAVDNAIVADVRAAVRALSTERDRFLRGRDVVRLAEREYAVAQEGARLGLITTFQLLQYEDQLSQARLLDAQARFAVQDAGTQYRLATGSVRARYGDVARQR
jgi:outer membrane protein TolC